MSNVPARKRRVPGYSGDFMEAVFRNGNQGIFPHYFLSYPKGNGWEVCGRKSDDFRLQSVSQVPQRKRSDPIYFVPDFVREISASVPASEKQLFPANSCVRKHLTVTTPASARFQIIPFTTYSNKTTKPYRTYRQIP